MSDSGTDVLNNGQVLLTPAMDIDEIIRGLAERAQRRRKPEAGLAWFFQHEPGSAAPTLTLGVRGTTGALMWFHAKTALVPSEGTNTEYVDYFTVDGHMMVMSPRAELPIERVQEALREFARSQQRPTCVDSASTAPSPRASLISWSRVNHTWSPGVSTPSISNKMSVADTYSYPSSDASSRA
ncbi:Imm1 family immunity protein [Saccharopolyspora sp. 5N102]|uniref:Imm1 family immunity protein n=1 Tax=Saccharopolyspora sp. 5N102 TaxID=3375155 RepID=UPI0037B4B23B